ncbi:Histidine biosynthesis bifunctional protein hisB [Brettanomyces nanus]|uniref:Imidazole glycerol phosphate synthase hisHF n=1 Tax=Eeniella nana TaxID=13502 RepID=A0A875S182_EENNA|nr:Histidine biosynthesis bifunctional protein hisB [Brettanomyces nanus]QPG74673.1 Histidine biosynthesis bifunctional protein hisB [Brettanomyces nanus]
MPIVYIIDVESGNLRSLQNAVEYLGYETRFIKHGSDPALKKADKLILPGVGNFGHFVKELRSRDFFDPLTKYVESGKSLMGICVGLQALFKGSEESPDVGGLKFIDLRLKKFNDSNKSVPQIGWNCLEVPALNGKRQTLYDMKPDARFYFVHSYAAIVNDDQIAELSSQGWDLAISKYADEKFIAAVAKGNIFATQFHPEKSGAAGLNVIKAFLQQQKVTSLPETQSQMQESSSKAIEVTPTGLTRRIIACLDVRTNDQADLVVTKGDQYDVREKRAGGDVKSLGKPVQLAEKYYRQGADEVTFLNITSFRNSPIKDQPMLEVLRQAAKTCFVPLTVGGGIKTVLDSDGTEVSALDIATLYFRAGADKVSIGSDSVKAAEEFIASGEHATGKTPIETISRAYGNQAVVISVDPKRYYVADPVNFKYNLITTATSGPDGEKYCYYRVTSQGGRKVHELGAYELCQACEKLGAGEILLNCIDKDGTNSGYDFELINQIKSAVRIPVIASSGAGNPQDFVDVFKNTKADAALGAGIFHRGEYTVTQVKRYMRDHGMLVRIDETQI